LLIVIPALAVNSADLSTTLFLATLKARLWYWWCYWSLDSV